MKLLIFSDVHGNLPAFEIVLKDAGICDGYICLGDLVNYGPWSNECVDLALSLPNSILIMGNHEEAFIKGAYNGKNDLVKDFFKQTWPSFNRVSQIKSFQQSYKLKDYNCVHTIQNRNIYEDTIVELDADFIIGHSHHQFHNLYNGFNLYNVGSVGQNRKYINIANYIIYNTETNVIEMKSVKFDINYVIEAMKRKSYPQKCISYYQQKLVL